MSDFRPPKPNRIIIALSELLLPFYLNFVERLSFKFSHNPDRPIDFFKSKKVVIVINHSDRQDPLLVVALAKHMHEDFYCIAAREVFDWSYGILGWLFQRFGCFSVDRGTTDFRSIHMIQKILTESQRKFIVFPEGEVTGDDYHVHEIAPTLMNILLKAQLQIENDDSPQSIWILPVGVSYKLGDSLEKSIGKTLRKVEDDLHIKCEKGTDEATRVTNSVSALLSKLSTHYQFAPSENQLLHKYAGELAKHICMKVSVYCGTEHPVWMTDEQFLHCLRSDLSKRLDLESQRNNLFRDLDRAERLLIVQRVLNQIPSPIQLCRIVDFLESEMYGRMTAKGRQSASVYFGTPIEILPYLQIYKSDKAAAADRLRDAVRDGLQLALDNSHSASGPKHKKVHSGKKLASRLERS